MIEFCEQVHKTHKNVSRKGLLKGIAGAAGLTVSAAIKEVTNPGYIKKIISSAFAEMSEEIPDVVDAALTDTAKGLDMAIVKQKRVEGAPKLATNKSYKPVFSQILEAAENYRRNRRNGGKLSFTRFPDFKSESYYLKSGIQEARKGHLFEQKYLSQLEDILVPQTLQRLTTFGSRLQSYLTPGSGMYRRVCEKFGFDLLDNPTNREFKWKEVVAIAEEYLLDLKYFIEAEAVKSGKPISASRIVEYFLEKNGGSLSESLLDTAASLRLFSRSDIEHFEEYSTTIANEEWMCKHIKDEFGKVINYRDLDSNIYPVPDGSLPVDQDLSRINQVGKPYHAYSLIARLAAFPPIVLKLATLKLYYSPGVLFEEQGFAKFSSDIWVLTELDSINKYLERFIPPHS